MLSATLGTSHLSGVAEFGTWAFKHSAGSKISSCCIFIVLQPLKDLNRLIFSDFIEVFFLGMNVLK